MHILAGLVLLLVAFGAVFIIAQTDVLGPLAGSFGDAFGIRRSTSTPSNLSAYYRQVRVQFVATGSGLDEVQVVSLVANPEGEEGITVTGWTLRVGGDTYSIPKAANIYSPSVEGVPPEDIYLRAGSVLNFYSGKNPQRNQPQAIRASQNEWRIWLGKEFLPVPHGTIVVRDDKGKTVDQYEY